MAEPTHGTQSDGRRQPVSNEAWLNAGRALIAHVPPNPKPLADLLRSGKTVPNETVYLIAFLLDPPSVNSLGVQLKLVEAGGPVVESDHISAVEDLREVQIVNESETRSANYVTGYAVKIVGVMITCKYMAKDLLNLLGRWINHDI